MIEVKNLQAGYGGIRALKGVDFSVAQGEMVALIGPNGAGKSTLLNSVSGIVRPSEGSILFAGTEIRGWPAWKVSRIGVIQSPEGRQVVGGMTVFENLQLGSIARLGRPPTHTLERIYDLFPVLAERRTQLAGSLSGGQQQMLAIGRALMGAPRILLLDEPSLGLAPVIVQQVFAALAILKGEGMTILLVEQNAQQALMASDRSYVLEQGRFVLSGTSRDLIRDPAIVAHYLGLEAAPAD